MRSGRDVAADLQKIASTAHRVGRGAGDVQREMTMSKSIAPLHKGDAVYLVTPMRGREDWEVREASRPVEEDLRARGLTVYSPSEHAEKTGQEAGNPKDDAEGFEWDVEKILVSQALVLQRGWEHSSGGLFEITMANNLGRHVIEYDTWLPPVEKPGMQINYRSLPAPIAQAMLKIESTFTRKNADYAKDTNWRSNFDSIAAQMGFSALTAADTFVAVKQARLQALTANGRVNATLNEAIEDTYLDRMVYGVIAYALLLDDAADE